MGKLTLYMCVCVCVCVLGGGVCVGELHIDKPQKEISQKTDKQSFTTRNEDPVRFQELVSKRILPLLVSLSK